MFAHKKPFRQSLVFGAHLISGSHRIMHAQIFSAISTARSNNVFVVVMLFNIEKDISTSERGRCLDNLLVRAGQMSIGFFPPPPLSQLFFKCSQTHLTIDSVGRAATHLLVCQKLEISVCLFRLSDYARKTV